MMQTLVDRYQYLALMAACLVITLPLEFMLGARVYRRPRLLVRAIGAPLIVFFVWDAIAVDRHVWWFSPVYTTGWRVVFHVPVEEVVFFVVIPLCALLTYEAVGRLLSVRAHG